MGQGYTYSVFNLVYESNTASTRIWDSLGFKRIGRVPGCGHLKSSSEPVDAVIYGRDLKADGENDSSEERFDKIRYYLRHQLYPQGADRSEKSRLRSAATHYKLVGGQDGVPEKLFLKDKEVISDLQAQYEIAKQIHLQAHGGINKTTAIIATKYHWIRIKETVSHVIKNCPECKDVNKAPIIRSENRSGRSRTIDEAPAILPQLQASTGVQSAPQDELTINDMSDHQISDHHLTDHQLSDHHLSDHHLPDHHLSDHQISDHHLADHHIPDHHISDHQISDHDFVPIQQPMDLANDHLTNADAHLHHDAHLHSYDEMAIDPQIMEQIQAMASEYDQNPHAYVQAGMAAFGETPNLQSHHDPHEFDHQVSDHQFINDTTQSIMGRDHVMDEGGAGTGLSNMQPMQHVLPMDYIDPSNNPPYKLEQ